MWLYDLQGSGSGVCAHHKHMAQRSVHLRFAQLQTKHELHCFVCIACRNSPQQVDKCHWPICLVTWMLKHLWSWQSSSPAARLSRCLLTLCILSSYMWMDASTEWPQEDQWALTTQKFRETWGVGPPRGRALSVASSAACECIASVSGSPSLAIVVWTDHDTHSQGEKNSSHTMSFPAIFCREFFSVICSSSWSHHLSFLPLEVSLWHPLTSLTSPVSSFLTSSAFDTLKCWKAEDTFLSSYCRREHWSGGDTFQCASAGSLGAHVFLRLCDSVFGASSSAEEQACLCWRNLVKCIWERALPLSFTKNHRHAVLQTHKHTHTHKPLTGCSLRSQKRNLNPLSLTIC